MSNPLFKKLELLVTTRSCRQADSCYAARKLSFAVGFPLTAGFACNCKGSFATLAEQGIA